MQLKPCPFCGSERVFLKTTQFTLYGSDKHYHVLCDTPNCGGRSRIGLHGATSIKEAKNAWNKRANENSFYSGLERATHKSLD